MEPTPLFRFVAGIFLIGLSGSLMYLSASFPHKVITYVSGYQQVEYGPMACWMIGLSIVSGIGGCIAVISSFGGDEKQGE